MINTHPFTQVLITILPLLFNLLLYLLAHFPYLLLPSLFIHLPNYPHLFSNDSYFRVAALSDPIKRFDGLDHTYPLQNFLADLSARVAFQNGAQPLDIQSYLTWHSRRVSLLYCSLTGKASNWYDRQSQVYKNELSSFLQFLKTSSTLKNLHTMLKLKHFLLFKK